MAKGSKSGSDKYKKVRNFELYQEMMLLRRSNATVPVDRKRKGTKKEINAKAIKGSMKGDW